MRSTLRKRWARADGSSTKPVWSPGKSVVVVPSRGALPRGLGAGSTVDVWSARELDRGSYEPPAVLVANAEIAGIQEPEGMVDTGDRKSVV